MTVSSILHAAASQIDGGARSFPVAHDAAVRLNSSYQAPNIDYEKLFHFQAARPSQHTPDFSAGWLMPDDRSQCNPVFVANSVLSAIWLLRKTLPDTTLQEDGWQTLVRAAIVLSADDRDVSLTDSEGVPPSAQRVTVIVDSDDNPSPRTTLKRKAHPSPTSTPSSSPKRRQGTRTSSSPPSGQVQSPRQPEPDTSPEPSPVFITKVTNNNRRAELIRTRRLAEAKQRRRQSSGLREPAVEAKAAERIAYHAIDVADDPQIAWIIKQPAGKDSTFYQQADSPYQTACRMLANARAVGNQPALYCAAAFLREWRKRGAPVSSRTTPPISSQLVVYARCVDDSDSDFQRAWHMSHYCEQQMATVVIEYRWAMALLGRAYANKIAQIQQGDRAASRASRNRRGQGTVRGQAVDTLLHLLHPDCTDGQRKPLREAFRKRLVRAERWFRATNVLGWGSLCLMPLDPVSNRWVEKDIHTDEWSIWLELVKKVNPDAHHASKLLDSWIGEEGILGGSIQSKEMLYIEEKGPTVVYEVEEIADSAEEEDSDSDVESTAQPPTSTSRQLRQLTLLDLFKPQ